ncbi:cupredoxin domain-containing protein [Gemmatimonas groenlandica]|uniref:Cupredoxin domain-containing protein n=1 Tax=Gemmatimonas groenlandica TaxID=2732249 RepID=A0A6M4IT76_9BACT|nr:cupredoxin domain-containing protein [Gemmatimonas groenlandica]QJR37318.1 cupredoxin domain-containing protein [Gemmatimonas groenlandica]
MTGIEWIVVLGGTATIVWINWYFFASSPVTASVTASAVASVATAGATATAGPPSITITVDGGYSPQSVQVPAGQPVRLIFDRRDTGSCSDEVVFPDFGIRKFLPTGQQTTIEITPPKAGTYAFMCGMSMLRGSVIAVA